MPRKGRKKAKQEQEEELTDKLSDLIPDEEPEAPEGVIRKEGEKPKLGTKAIEKEDDIEDYFDDDDDEEEKPIITPGDLDFVDLMKRVDEALKSDEGKKLNCRVKVVVKGKQAFIYQGLKNNVYARLFQDRKHFIYRYTLKRLLMNHEATKYYFNGDTIRT